MCCYSNKTFAFQRDMALATSLGENRTPTGIENLDSDIGGRL